MTEKEAIAVAKRSIIEDCPEFSEKECEHVAYRVVEALRIEGLELSRGHYTAQPENRQDRNPTWITHRTGK